MWLSEQGAVTEIAPESIWRVWADIDSWPAWDPYLEKAEADGPLAVGTRLRLTEAGRDPVDAVVSSVVEGSSFAIGYDLGDATVRMVYRITEWAGRTRLSVRVEIAGPGAGRVGPQVGPTLTERLPETLTATIRAAKP